jgi:tetratricopeptide (TPR) repeat protein
MQLLRTTWGIAYANLPSATPEQRAENVRKAIEYYKAALEIYKKDEYPQYYCQTAANLGLTLALINNPDACYWLKEAYALREYLKDQGKQLEEVIRRICKEERK